MEEQNRPVEAIPDLCLWFHGSMSTSVVGDALQAVKNLEGNWEYGVAKSFKSSCCVMVSVQLPEGRSENCPALHWALARPGELADLHGHRTLN